jgi:single-stranded-DNA-specific exonuclease
LKYTSLYRGYDFIHEENLLQTLLINRDVSEPDRLLNLSDKEIHDGMLLKNMKQGLELLHKHINDNSVIHIIVDSDNDGISSAGIIYLYIKDIKPNIKITYSLHKGKEHGIILGEITEYKYNLLIVPDAGTDNIEESKTLSDKGIDILVLDHHDIEKDNSYATVINCKDGQYPNNTLSGAGIVYKFIKEYDKKYNIKYADRYLDLLALGCIGDVVDLRNFETRCLVLKGIENFAKYNEFLQALVNQQEYSLQGAITIKGIGWYIVPLLNAVIRVGEPEDKINVFRALIGEQEDIEYQPRRKKKDDPLPPIEIHSLQQTMARICVNLKSKQDRLVKKGVEELNEKITSQGLDNNKILIVDVTNELDSTFTGLVANKLSNDYKRPSILLRKKKDAKDGVNLYGGSCRNYNLFPIINFKDFLNELNTFNSLAGHGNAFGFEIKEENITVTQEKANKALDKVKIEDVYKVDYEIPIGRLKNRHIEQVGKWNDLWGNQLDEPLFAITDIYISTDKIKLIGSKQNIIKFEANNITFIKKYANEDIYNSMILKKSKGLNRKHVDRVKMDIVGKFVINTWEDKEYPQIEIVDFNVIEDNEILF